MPSVSKFKAGFGLTHDIEGCPIHNLHIDHHHVIKYRHYKYLVSFELDHCPDYRDKVKRHLAGHKIINSDYGNPYDCSFESINFSEIGTKVHVDAVAHAYRV